MTQLCDMTCRACRGDEPPLRGAQLQDYLARIEGWQLVDETKIVKAFKFKNFSEALSFVVRVGDLAEQQGHHPDILLSWGRVRIELSTHKIQGLSESDFILAAKIDTLPR